MTNPAGLPLPIPHKLTPAQLQTLRDSVRWRVAASEDRVIGKRDGEALGDLPYIVWMDHDQGWCLRQQGRTWALSPTPEPLLACLIAERVEPGYIRRIMDTATPCDVAALEPDTRMAVLRQREADAAIARSIQREADEEARRKRLNIRPNPIAIDMEDLL